MSKKFSFSYTSRNYPGVTQISVKFYTKIIQISVKVYTFCVQNHVLLTYLDLHHEAPKKVCQLIMQFQDLFTEDLRLTRLIGDQCGERERQRGYLPLPGHLLFYQLLSSRLLLIYFLIFLLLCFIFRL